VTSSSPPTGDVRDCEPTSAEVRAAFPTAPEIALEWHLRMHAAMSTPPYPRRQTPRHGDCPDDARAIYPAAWKAKVKGITV
jgi:ribonucleoside-diphosphate reductase alpha chain